MTETLVLTGADVRALLGWDECIAAVEAALKRLEGGRSVVVFPEETRSPTGERVPFKKGAALLALRSGLPILPIGLAGTFRVLPRGTFQITPGPGSDGSARRTSTSKCMGSRKKLDS